MTNPDLQLIQCDWLLVGFRGGRAEQFRAINLCRCRRFDGAVLFREGDVMVVEIGAYPEVIDDLLARLPRRSVTHLWRSGTPVTTQAIAFPRDPIARPRSDEKSGSLVPALHP